MLSQKQGITMKYLSLKSLVGNMVNSCAKFWIDIARVNIILQKNFQKFIITQKFLLCTLCHLNLWTIQVTKKVMHNVNWHVTYFLLGVCPSVPSWLHVVSNTAAIHMYIIICVKYFVIVYPKFQGIKFQKLDSHILFQVQSRLWRNIWN